MLTIESLCVSAEGKSVLSNINLQFQEGKTYFLLGKNGSGKTSLSLALMGHPKYSVTSGSVFLDEEDLLAKTSEARAAAGLFLSLQNIPEIRGVKISEYLRTIINAKLRRNDPSVKSLSPFIVRRMVIKECESLGIPETFLDRELNVGFSGGEKRRLELLQMKLLDPKVVILDEIDSGLDIDAFKTVATSLAECRSTDRTLVIVTHNFLLAQYLPPDFVVILEAGKIKET